MAGALGLSLLSLQATAPGRRPQAAGTAAHGDHLQLTEWRIPASADASVRSADPERNFGGEGSLELGPRFGQPPSTSQILLGFPFDHVPEGATVVSATLVLAQTSALGQADLGLSVQEVAAPWDESKVTWSSRPSARGPSVTRFLKAGRGRVEIDVLPLATAWPNGGKVGLLLSAGESPCQDGRSRSFDSREQASSGAEPPLLVLSFVGAGTPHPFPSPSPSPTVPPSTTPSPTAGPSPTPTPTSNRPSLGQIIPLEPGRGAVLAPPFGADRWIFRWDWTGFTPVCQEAVLDLDGPRGRISRSQAFPQGCMDFALDPPWLSEDSGSWAWSLRLTCLPFRDSRYVGPLPFSVRSADTPTPGGGASATPTLVGTATPIPGSVTPDPGLRDRLYLPRLSADAGPGGRG